MAQRFYTHRKGETNCVGSAISWNLGKFGSSAFTPCLAAGSHGSLGDLLPDSFHSWREMRTFTEALMFAYNVPAQVEKNAQS